ncbi:MAG: VWA domain-containing protein, partial [Flavobacteriales bacterium]
MKRNWKHSVFIILLAELVFWIVGGTVYQYFTQNFSEFRMEHEEFWIYLLGSRVLFIGFILSRLGVQNRLKKYADGDSLPKITHNFSVVKNTFKFVTLLYGISFLILAWANPQFGKDEKKMNTSGIDIMVCLDVSNSMLAKDLAGNMNRLEVAKLAIRNLLRELKGDRVGVVVFAGSAYDYIPITNDYEYIKLEMLSINPGMMSTQGTAIGTAIETAMNSFEKNKTNKAILVFTDGENHE